MNDKTIIRPGGKPKRSGNKSNSPLKSAMRRDGTPRRSLSDLVNQQHFASTPMGEKDERPGAAREFYTHHSDDIKSILAPVLLLVSQVKNVQKPTNLEELKSTIKEKISFLQSTNFGQHSDFTASEEVTYGLCCYIDETVLNTPWGSHSSWSQESLLVIFFKETWGGERFFQILDSMKNDPSYYIDIIEVYNIFLELGFEGQYRHQPDGTRILSQIKEENFLLISQYKPGFNNPLSDQWRPHSVDKATYLKTIPQWAVWTSVVAVCLAVFFYLNLSLSSHADPVKRKLVELRNVGALGTIDNPFFYPEKNSIPIKANTDTTQTLYTLLTDNLKPEISTEIFMLDKVDEGVIVRMSRPDLFNSGSDKLSEHYIPSIEKLARILNNTNTSIVISGHSDDVPIRTIKYPDNWALSEARAITVKKILQAQHENSLQILARGLADTINLAPNTTPENRAKNRRVEILIKG
ncbi:type IVB secretion system protein IcmH/DotU [Alteromonas sp. ASW11-130]|uniref:type IVB secretion system protein IcmH/DotU n=1 Tax=Alteromonas sp. ASW11-130 TaxID=3015775 RepID=UPI002241D169|nr:type IVB secretion system protein IcmH/DotU [Alteromonas sp. ASW11-130]MCW8090304.1 type IVB secretion system protein IcmH/DotU [Alteromonas sp. ASW11-130]